MHALLWYLLSNSWWMRSLFECGHYDDSCFAGAAHFVAYLSPTLLLRSFWRNKHRRCVGWPVFSNYVVVLWLWKQNQCQVIWVHFLLFRFRKSQRLVVARRRPAIVTPKKNPRLWLKSKFRGCKPAQQPVKEEEDSVLTRKNLVRWQTWQIRTRYMDRRT